MPACPKRGKRNGEKAEVGVLPVWFGGAKGKTDAGSPIPTYELCQGGGSERGAVWRAVERLANRKGPHRRIPPAEKKKSKRESDTSLLARPLIPMIGDKKFGLSWNICVMRQKKTRGKEKKTADEPLEIRRRTKKDAQLIWHPCPNRAT